MSNTLTADYVALYDRLPKGKHKIAFSYENVMDAKALGRFQAPKYRLCEFAGYTLYYEEFEMMSILEACGAIKVISRENKMDAESFTPVIEMEFEVLDKLTGMKSPID